MKPPFSVIFFTTLIGAGQGLFLALYIGEVYVFFNMIDKKNPFQMIETGLFLVVILIILGLFASMFHLGRPERSWRAMSQWRTSWLSREIIVLMIFVIMVIFWGLVYFGKDGLLLDNFNIHTVLLIGFIATIVAIFLYICTAMIYVIISFIQEWATSLTVFNYVLLGLSSGFVQVTALASYFQSPLRGFYTICTLILILAAMIVRLLSLYRNKHIKYNSTIKTALGVKDEKVRRIPQKYEIDTYSARKFFHYSNFWLIQLIKWLFLIFVFVIPFFLVILGWNEGGFGLLVAAVFIQYIGLLAERWYFFAQTNHPQNIYKV
jgi:sulfite dehydrogenase (quinone) subunit SoeC